MSSPLDSDDVYNMKLYKKAKVSEAQQRANVVKVLLGLLKKIDAKNLLFNVTLDNFRILDKNKNGFLSKREVFQNLYNQKLSDIEIIMLDAMFRYVDKNNKNGLSPKEFLHSKKLAVYVYKKVMKQFPEFVAMLTSSL
jgi:hypothetical protein